MDKKFLYPTNTNGWVQIGVWGDSIVHGGRDHEYGGWVNRLWLYTTNRGLGSHIFNVGLGGQNSREVLARIGFEVKARTIHIDHVIVGVGMNDLIYQIKLQTPEQYRECLCKICEEVQALDKNLILLSVTPCSYPDQEKWKALNDIVREVSKKYDTGYIDLGNAFGPDDYGDAGIHPNAKGHEGIFQTVKKYLIDTGIMPKEA